MSFHYSKASAQEQCLEIGNFVGKEGIKFCLKKGRIVQYTCFFAQKVPSLK